MKTLLGGIVLIVVLGVAGLLYRTVLEHPAPATSSGQACTLEAKICPDGTTVSRVAPSCEFAACPFPNVSLLSAAISFALPAGYAASPLPATASSTLIAIYQKDATSTSSSAITIHDYPLAAGSTTAQVMLANTVLEPSGMPPKDTSAFSPKIIGTNTYSSITLERFEGVVQSAYFLPRTSDVLEFDVVEHDVQNWNDPALIPDNLPEHAALIQMLGTLEDDSPRPE